MPFLKIGPDQGMLTQLLAGLKASPEQVYRATRSAVRTGAFYFKTIFANVVKGNEFSWPKLKVFPKIPKGIPPAGRKNLRKITRNTSAGTSTKFLGKLARVFRYVMSADGLSAESGTLDETTSQSGKNLFRIFQEGQTKPTSFGLRRYFAAVGYPLSPNHKPIVQPSRDLVTPAWDRNKGNLQKIMAAKMAAVLGGLK